ncbi:hypothetical protein M513_08204 [Trichuris suis]|uniref:Receptor protein-tyrosine kinase n=1 Tax=Trichuris suis TaxID=68888 RepID=A0A085M0Z5_9BILA|nr:hypothetical protein M513_08204 [Trichuris suis]
MGAQATLRPIVELGRLVACILLSRILAGSSMVASGPCHVDEAFYFNVQPKGITVREGSRAFLECNVSSGCNVQFHWVLSDAIVVNTTRRYQNGSNLVITRVNRSLDSGEFYCIATISTTGLAKQSQPASLAILWINENAVVTALSLPEIRGELQLRCDAEGYDEPVYRWFHNGHRLRRTDRVTWRGRRLTIHAITVRDNGVYSCEAENSAGLIRSAGNFVLSLPSSGNGPDIVEVPKAVIVRAGTAAQFDCVYRRAHVVYWRKVGADPQLKLGVDPESTRIRQLENNSLIIDDVRPEDEGSYECIAEGAPIVGTDGTSQPLVQSFGAHLSLATLNGFRGASFEPVRDLYVISQGKRFEVACIPPTGQPTPNVYWTRGDVPIGDQGRIRATDDYSLIIDSARADDKGEYDCVAENLAGIKKGTIFVHVSKPPVIERHPSSLEVEEGSDARMDCSFRGNEYPVTLIEWEKDQTLIAQAKHRSAHRHYFPDNGTLFIRSVTVSDAGEYTCIVKTHEQHVVYSQPALLRVRERLKFSPRPVDRKLELHSDAHIPCRAVGYAPAKVKWVQVGRITEQGAIVRFGQPVANFPSHIRDKEGVLYFHQTRFEDSGLYMCVAVSSQGVINVTIKIEVIVSPVFELVPANVTVEEEQDVWLHCSVRGTPRPTVQWYFEGIPDSEWTFPFRKFSNNTLVLLTPSMEQAGKYNCMAGNKGGFKRHEGLVCIKLKSSNISHCGRHVGLQRSFASREAAVVLQVDPGKGITLTTIGIACGAAAGYILLAVFLVSYCGYRRRRSRLTKSSQCVPLQVQAAGGKMGIANGLSLSSVQASGNGELLLPVGASSCNQNSSSACVSTSISSRRTRLTTTFERLQYPREYLQYVSTLGSGIYGDVYLMKGGQLKEDEAVSTVVVKSLLSKDDFAQTEFLKEMEMHARCDHPNIARLLGICTMSEPVLVILEYLDYGNLKHYLQASRHYRSSSLAGQHSSYPPPLSSAQMRSIALQASEAMDHLSCRRFVHKDFAARNVLISSKYFVKVTHLNLNNDQFLAEYYTYRNLVLPLRWMPDEALFDDDWSMKSDVWSFGVFLWEMYTMGELPYQSLSNDQVIDGLKRRELRLSLPANMPVQWRHLVCKCTETNCKERPTFGELRELLIAQTSPVQSDI